MIECTRALVAPILVSTGAAECVQTKEEVSSHYSASVGPQALGQLCAHKTQGKYLKASAASILRGAGAAGAPPLHTQSLRGQEH